jgi:serine/threonine protein kinase
MLLSHRRDIKPSNIMLTEKEGRLVCKLIDFSISAVEHESRADVSQTLQTGTTSLQVRTIAVHTQLSVDLRAEQRHSSLGAIV